MLTTETITVGDARAELTEWIEALDEALEEVNDETNEAAALRDRKGTLGSWRNGLNWMVEERDWTDDTELTVGALTAGEEAMMYRSVPSEAGPNEERIWYAAAATESAPYVADDLEETFANLANVPPSVVKWLEAKANQLGTASDEGNKSSESSPATDSEAISPQPPDSTT